VKHSYWHDERYLRPLCRQIPNLKKYLLDYNKIPILIINHPKGFHHLATPPGFLSCQNESEFSSHLKFLESLRKDFSAITAFLQYRGRYSPNIDQYLEKSSVFYSIEKKNMVYVELLEEKIMFDNCKRSTKSRLRPTLEKGIIHKHKLDNKLWDLYEIISKDNNFGISYRYSPGDLKSMSESSNLYPVSIYDTKSNFLGGSLVGKVNDDCCDYIISAYDKRRVNSGRAVLWQSLIAAKELGFKKVNLGGGVEIGDGLESFKLSFGGIIKNFYSIKIIFDEFKFNELFNTQRPIRDLKGKFPPS